MTKWLQTQRRTVAATLIMSVAQAVFAAPAIGPWARRRSGLTWQRALRWTAQAERLAARLPWPNLLFALATVVTIRMVGYHFGTWDQTLIISILNHQVDPTLYAGDPFTALMPIHVTYFWDLFIPFYRAGWLEPAVFTAFVLSVYLLYWSVWSLTQALFKNNLTSAVSVAALMLPHFGLAGISQVGYSLVSWTGVLPFTLWALTLFVRRRYLAAFGLLGLLYNFHVISVNFVLGMIVLASLADLRRVGIGKLAAGLALFVAGALPVLIWKGSSGPLDLSWRPEWVALMTRVANPLLYQVFWPSALGLSDTASFAALVAMFFIARRLAPPSAAERASGAARSSLWWMIGVLLVVAVEWVALNWLPVTLLIELQLTRIGIYALVLGYVYFAHYLVTAYQSGQLSRFDFIALVLALALPPAAYFVLILWAVGRWVGSARWRPAVVSSLAGATLGAGMLIGSRLGMYDPRVQVEARQDDWYAAQVWAREHTAKQAVFITPPQMHGYLVPGWRVYSQRGTVTTLGDLIDVGYNPEYYAVWQPRFEALAPGALARFRGEWTENIVPTAQAFYGLSDAQVLAAAREYGADYLVVEKPHRRPWPVAYENGGFVIYDLRGVTVG